MSTTTEIRDCLIDATVTHGGVEVLSYAEVYMALSQSLDGTLPEGYVVEWGPRSGVCKRVIAEASESVWRAALDGDLSL